MAVNDAVIQPKTPATGSEQGNQSNVFYNVRINGILYIPVVGAPTFNGGKVQDGAMVLSNDVLHIYADGEWKSYVTLEYAEANFAMLNDGLLEVGDITLAELNVTVVAPVKWRINSVDYQKLSNTVIAITPATASYNRIDLIYATTAGTILKIQGTETLGVAVEPTLPANTIRVAPVYINGSTVTPPAPDLSGYATIPYVNGLDANNVKLNPSAPQIGVINLDSGSEGNSFINRFAIKKAGTNELWFGLKNETYDARFLITPDIMGTSDPYFTNSGNYGGARKVLLEGDNATLGTLSLSTTPTTDANPANILTWDATTKEVKRVGYKTYNAKDFGAKADGVTDDTNIIQDYLNSNQPSYIFPKGNYSVSGLDVNQNSTLIFEEGAVLLLRNNSNRPVLQNKNYALTTDENISIYGLNIDGNFANQIRIQNTGPNIGEPTSGIRFFGVKNLKIENAVIKHAKTYSIWLSRIDGLVARNIEFNQDTLTYGNQDGIHINGWAKNLYLSNIGGLTNDDMIALNCDDVAQGAFVSNGDITNAIIDGVIFKNNLNGIRLLSATSRLDQIQIRNLVGSVRDNVVAISAYQLGVGNFGNIDISGVDVRTSTPYNVMGEYGGYILVNDKADHIKISNVNRVTGDDARPTVRVQGRADIGTLDIDGVTTKINPVLTTYYPDISFEDGSNVKNAFVSNHKLLNGVFPNGYGIGLTGSTVEKLHIKTLYYEQIGYGLYLNNSDVTTLFSDGTNTNFIRYPFYLINGSNISFALITDQLWAYTLTTPADEKEYYVLDTSTMYVVDTGTETLESVTKRGNIIPKILNGSIISPAKESLFRYGIDGLAVSEIKGLNTFGDNLGTGLAFVVNNPLSANTPIEVMTLTSSGLDVNGSIRASSNDGTPTAVVRNSDLPQNVAPSSALTLALTNNTSYTFNGTTSVWTLPTIASGKLGDRIFIMNMGSGMVTVNSNSGGNDIYNSGTLTNTLGVNVGEIAVFYNNGISFFRQL